MTKSENLSEKKLDNTILTTDEVTKVTFYADQMSKITQKMKSFTTELGEEVEELMFKGLNDQVLTIAKEVDKVFKRRKGV